MTKIDLIVNGSKAQAEVDGILTSGAIGIPVTIQYDSSWDGLTKHLVCTSGKWGPTGKPRAMLNVDAASTVPQEVMIADNHLYLGVAGHSKDGNLLIPTIWADCGPIFPGADTNADPSAHPTLPMWAQLQQQVQALNELKPTDSQIAAAVASYFEENGNCLTRKQTRSLDNLFKACSYIKPDISGDYAAFQAAFGLTDQEDSGGSEDEDDGGETVAAYTVTNILTGVITDNPTTIVLAGSSYIANLTVAEGYSLEHLIITHNGEDVTNSVYGDGYILITNVSGDIIITAVAAERKQVETLSVYADSLNLYSDAGSTSLGTKYYLNGIESLNATETDTAVTLELTNTSDTDVTFVGYMGCNTIRMLYFADSGRSFTVPTGRSVTCSYTVRAGYKFVFAGIPKDGSIQAKLYGVFDVYEPTAEFPVQSKYFDNIKTYSDGTTNVLLKNANYQYVVCTSEVFALDTDLIITIVGGESNTIFTGTDWYFGSSDPAKPNTVFHGIKIGGANTEIAAGQILKYTYTVKGGCVFSISNVINTLTPNMVYVEKA